MKKAGVNKNQYFYSTQLSIVSGHEQLMRHQMIITDNVQKERVSGACLFD